MRLAGCCIRPVWAGIWWPAFQSRVKGQRKTEGRGERGRADGRVVTETQNSKTQKDWKLLPQLYYSSWWMYGENGLNENYMQNEWVLQRPQTETWTLCDQFPPKNIGFHDLNPSYTGDLHLGHHISSVFVSVCLHKLRLNTVKDHNVVSRFTLNVGCVW